MTDEQTPEEAVEEKEENFNVDPVDPESLGDAGDESVPEDEEE